MLFAPRYRGGKAHPIIIPKCIHVLLLDESKRKALNCAPPGRICKLQYGESETHRVCASATDTNVNAGDPPPTTSTTAVTIVITEVAINHRDEEEPSRAKAPWRPR